MESAHNDGWKDTSQGTDMKIYRNEQDGFELQIPREWSLRSEDKAGLEDSLIFNCRPWEAFNIRVGRLIPEPALDETERSFSSYTEEQGYTSLAFGRIQAAGKVHVWARYYVGGGVWNKKYMLVLQGVEFAMTASCFDQRYLLEMEKSWDQVVSTFRSLSPRFDLEHVMQVLARPSALADIPERIELCRQALDHVDRHRDPEIWAGLQVELAKNLAQNPLGDPVQKIEQAILHNQNALEVFSREAYPEEWANTQINLGSNYRHRLVGSREQNIEASIHHCLQALEVLNILEYPRLWANAHTNLANSYRDRLYCDRADNLEECIEHCRQALLVFTRQAYPVQWAIVQNNLGNAYQERLLGDPGSDLEEALKCYQRALQVFTRVDYPDDWAWTQGNLGALYHERHHGDPARNIELSIHHSMQALEVFRKDSHPEKWALAHLNLGSAYLLYWSGERDKALKQSLEHYRLALTVLTQQTHPVYWRKAQEGMAQANQELPPQEYGLPPAPCKEDIFPRLSYPDLYRAACHQDRDKKCELRLRQAGFYGPDMMNSFLLVYKWEGELSSEEADRLRRRAAVYLASAIYDAARSSSLPCELSPIPNGERPAWFIPDEASPISVTISDADPFDKTLQLSVGPMLIDFNRMPVDRAAAQSLLEGFQRQFSHITV